MKKQSEILNKLDAIARVIEKLSPPSEPVWDFSKANGFLWHAPNVLYKHGYCEAIEGIHALPLHLFFGVDSAIKQLYTNTKNFCKGLPANNVLLWGSRGMGKSSVIKSVYMALVEEGYSAVKLIEIEREDINSLPELLNIVKKEKSLYFVVFCDDLSFDTQDNSYKALKSVLEGGIQGRPDNCIFYATSNRRHLMSRQSIENEMETAQFSHETVEEKLSLSDRFGVWIGFHKCNQDNFLAMVKGYKEYYNIPITDAKLKEQAIEWSMMRGGRSGRVAWQFTQHMLGQTGVRIK